MTTMPSPLERQPSNDFVLQVADAGSRPKVLYSNNQASSDFVVVVQDVEGSSRRELRSSKELSEHDRAALAKLVDPDAPEEERTDVDGDDESGVGVKPSPSSVVQERAKERRPSLYKNGRRLSDPAMPTCPAAQLEPPPVPLPKQQKGALPEDPKSKEPGSPTGVISSFFGDMLGGSSVKLLGGVATV
jgi:hypothetical protein